MGLTRPRAHQLQDATFKQTCRVLQTSNITLSGGAPSTVDGVSLSLNDRVLVSGQSTGSQNGLYRVTVVGTGSNGTWARTADGDEDGDITAGMTIMVTEGTTNADTMWKLTTDDPITVGTTALTFEQFGGGGSGDPAGSDTQVQFNDAGSFAGDAGLTYNKTTDSLTVVGTVDMGTLSIGSTAVTATAAEINLVDGSAAGTIVNNKAVIYDANGDVIASGISTPDITHTGTTGVGNIGAVGDTFNTVFAKATSAQYADLAERYTTDEVYAPGTVVVIGGMAEATACTLEADHAVLGIISTDPAYKMNQSIEGQDIALVGRVPCKVVGEIRKGDLLVTSSTPGHAMSWNPAKYVPGSVVGKALESKSDDGEGVIEVAVGRH